MGERFKDNKHTFLGDSGASTHMGNSDEGMYDVMIISSPVKREWNYFDGYQDWKAEDDCNAK